MRPCSAIRARSTAIRFAERLTDQGGGYQLTAAFLGESCRGKLSASPYRLSLIIPSLPLRPKGEAAVLGVAAVSESDAVVPQLLSQSPSP